MHNLPQLQMIDIGKSFPGVRALDRVNFELNRAEVHILLGENGAGKSTLMKILSGAYPCDEGEIFVDGALVHIKNPKQSRELGIRIIYQEFNLIPHLSVSANIFLGAEPLKQSIIIDRQLIEQKTRAILKDLGVEIDPSARVSSLSVAEQQMVEVAKALAFDARILIMDEPTSALSSSEIATLFAMIGKIREKGVGIIYISHRLEELFKIGDRVTVLRDGKHVDTRQIADVTTRELVRLMANRELTEHFPKETVSPGEPLLEVRHLSTPNKLDDVRFTLRKGEILGIAGLMGAGRTELARAIFGLDTHASGEILLHGHPQKINSPATAIRMGIGLLPGDRKQLGLVLDLSVRQNITLANTDRLYARGVLRSGAERDMAEKYVADLGIKTPGIEQKVLYLSGGNQQKVVLGKWLARQSDIFIFDEPTRGIDVAAKVEIYNLMNRLVAAGAGIIMISSELPEILGMSDRILVMHDGKIRQTFTRAEATQEKIMAAALGENS